MKLSFPIILIILLHSCEDTTRFDLTKEEWIEDLEYLNDKIISKHKSPFHYTNKNEVESKLSDCIKSIKSNEMSGQGRALVLSEFTAQFGDGHTYINPYNEFKRFPIWLQWFQEKLIITAIDRTLGKYQGWEIVKIGDFETFEALQLIIKYIPQNESKNFIKVRSEFLLCLKDVLKHAGLLSPQDDLKLTVTNNDNEIESIIVPNKIFDVNKTITPEFKGELPLRFKQNNQLNYLILNKSKVGYFNFRSYPSRIGARKFGKDLNDWILKQKIEYLIIDFRLNGGGDFTIGRAILKQIKGSLLKSNIKVYIAIGKYTYSAGMSNASDFKNELGGVYIGQTTGAKPNGFQESYEFYLPNSNIQCSTSIEYYEFSKKNTDGIEPEIQIDYNWNKYYNGVDPLIDYILNNKQ